MKTTKPDRIGVSLTREEAARVAAIAEHDRRSLANTARLLILEGLPTYEAKIQALDKPKIADVGHHR